MLAVCRPARPEDLERANELVVRSMNDLTERHAFGPMASVRPPTFAAFSLRDDPDGLWVVEEGGQILGFGFSWVCADLWFLAQLFVSPSQQGSGVGGQLLKRTLEHAEKAGATHKALITFTFNRVSQGLYIRHGLFPRVPLYFVAAQREKLQGQLQVERLRCVPLEDRAADLAIVAQIDARTLGISREKHHRFLLSDPAMRGVLLYRGEDWVGYAYASAEGHVGPLAVMKPEEMGTAFRTALSVAADSNPIQVSAFLPGPSEAALGMAIAVGMQITFPMVLMSARRFGDWTSYLPRNPGFM
jgi:GNAT superfamily N-acetyltransferase